MNHIILKISSNLSRTHTDTQTHKHTHTRAKTKTKTKTFQIKSNPYRKMPWPLEEGTSTTRKNRCDVRRDHYFRRIVTFGNSLCLSTITATFQESLLLGNVTLAGTLLVNIDCPSLHSYYFICFSRIRSDILETTNSRRPGKAVCTWSWENARRTMLSNSIEVKIAGWRSARAEQHISESSSFVSTVILSVQRWPGSFF